MGSQALLRALMAPLFVAFLKRGICLELWHGYCLCGLSTNRWLHTLDKTETLRPQLLNLLAHRVCQAGAEATKTMPTNLGVMTHPVEADPSLLHFYKLPLPFARGKAGPWPLEWLFRLKVVWNRNIVSILDIPATPGGPRSKPSQRMATTGARVAKAQTKEREVG